MVPIRLSHLHYVSIFFSFSNYGPWSHTRTHSSGCHTKTIGTEKADELRQRDYPNIPEQDRFSAPRERWQPSHLPAREGLYSCCVFIAVVFRLLTTISRYNTSDFHRPAGRRVHQRRTAVRCSVGDMKSTLSPTTYWLCGIVGYHVRTFARTE